MLSIATDENNDIYLDEFGNLATVTGIEAVAQVCRNTVLTTYGESRRCKTSKASPGLKASIIPFPAERCLIRPKSSRLTER